MVDCLADPAAAATWRHRPSRYRGDRVDYHHNAVARSCRGRSGAVALAMKIRVLGGGIYGSHIVLALRDAGHAVELHESASRLFSGASGNQPARLHQGAHYPRSKLTRA